MIEPEFRVKLFATEPVMTPKLALVPPRPLYERQRAKAAEDHRPRARLGNGAVLQVEVVTIKRHTECAVDCILECTRVHEKFIRGKRAGQSRSGGNDPRPSVVNIRIPGIEQTIRVRAGLCLQFQDEGTSGSQAGEVQIAGNRQPIPVCDSASGSIRV